jgi:2-polyprenyl-6-methoxyphenol hydroxylase-like FAD-dependent oxidoreductase
VDAVVLGRVLTEALAGSGDAVLDRYEELRRAAAVEVLALAGRLTSMATVRGSLGRHVRNLGLAMLNVLSPAKRRLMRNLSGLSREHLAVVEPRGIAATSQAAAKVNHA